MFVETHVLNALYIFASGIGPQKEKKEAFRSRGAMGAFWSDFAEKMVGDGIAIVPTGSGEMLAPADGVVEKIFDTNHAFSIVTPGGIELFVHFGIDTVQLEGKGFERLVQEGATVKQGTPLIRYDYEFLKANAKSVQTPVIISNYEDYAGLEKVSSGTSVAGQTLVLEVKEK